MTRSEGKGDKNGQKRHFDQKYKGFRMNSLRDPVGKWDSGSTKSIETLVEIMYT